MIPALLFKKKQHSTSSFSSSQFTSKLFYSSLEPRILISGLAGMGQKYLGPAVLEKFEEQNFFVQALDLPSLLSESTRVGSISIFNLSPVTDSIDI